MNSFQRRKKRRRKSRENKRKIVEKSSQVVLHKYNIPQDIIDEILVRLPVKSFLRFKAVSKLWHATISNPSFLGRRRPATRIFAMVARHPLLFHSIDEKGSIEKFRLPDWCRLGYDDKEENCAEISNSCNGMLLLRLGKRIFLLNPSTHYIERVLTRGKGYYDARIGFCYNESIGDYKALIFPRSFNTTSILVASLKEKQWTELRIPTDFNFILSAGPLVNDRLHAIVYNAIVYFNPTKDVFEKIPCPQPKSGYKDEIVGLGVLEGCLCMARRIGENEHRGDVEVLKMKEYGVAESWTTLFVLKDFCDTRYWKIKLLLRTDDGNILFKYQGEIWRYNPADKSYTKFILEGNSNLSAVTFVDNLFSPSTRV